MGVGERSSTINCVAAGCFNPGVYGAQGTPSAGSIPGSRQDAPTWIDSSGNLWLLGGMGYDAGGTFGNLNDLWEFNPTTKLWTWMGGSRCRAAHSPVSTARWVPLRRKHAGRPQQRRQLD